MELQNGPEQWILTCRNIKGIEMKKGSILRHKINSFFIMTIRGFSESECSDRPAGRVRSESGQFSENSELPYAVCEYLKPPCEPRLVCYLKESLSLIRE